MLVVSDVNYQESLPDLANEVQLGLIWAGGDYQWQSAHVIASIVVGICVSVCFVLWQWKGASIPLIPG